MNDEYVRMEAVNGRLISDVTELDFGVFEGKMRIFCTGATKPLATPDEEFEQWHEEMEMRKVVEGKLNDAEAEIQRLKAELRKLKG